MRTGLLRVLHLSMALLALLVLSGCGGNAQPAIVTYVPTDTATAVPTPNATAHAVDIVVTSTPMPIRSPTTATPGPSPTNPLAPTQSPAPATQTATRAPTLAGVSIEYFTTNTEFARPGENVTLFWSVRGAAAVRIFRVDSAGERIWRWDVNPSGQITVGTRTADRDVARFLLEADVGGATIEQPLLIPLQCSELWFFDPAPESCPAEPPQTTTQAEQTFERGRMIWVQAQDRIYVVFEDGGSPAWAQYPDDFNEGDPERDESLVPPFGMEQPVRGFGLVWRSNQRVRDRLGWATSPEIAFEGMIQADSVESSVATQYMRMRDGGIIALDAQANTWEYIPFSTSDSAP